jgi:hypothetical protein
MSRFRPFALLICTAFATAASAQESVEVHRLLSEEDSAIDKLPAAQQDYAIFRVAAHCWLIRNRAATRAEIDRAKL